MIWMIKQVKFDACIVSCVKFEMKMKHLSSPYRQIAIESQQKILEQRPGTLL